MSLSQAFALATDSEFRTLVAFAGPPRAGRITAREASGQVRVEMDDPDGGDALAWPLNGAGYAVGDIVYCLFAANSPDSAIVLGVKGSTPTYDPLRAGEVRAADTSGLKLSDDSGNPGLFVADGGAVGLGTTSPESHAALHVHRSAATGVTGFITNDSAAHGAAASWRAGLDASNYAVDYVAATILGSGWNPAGNLKAKTTLIEGNGANLILSNYSASEPMQFCTGSGRTERLRITPGGSIGLNVASPQGRFHAWDGVAGQLLWSAPSVQNLAHTILADGVGDVAYGATFLYTILCAGVKAGAAAFLANGGNLDVAVGANTFRFAISADGAFTVVRTAGSAAGRVAVLALWL